MLSVWHLKKSYDTGFLQEVATYTLATPSSRFDYEVFGENGILFLNHMGNDSVILYDTHTNSSIKEISGIGSPRGVDFSPQQNRLYVTSPDSDEVAVIDLSTNSIIKRISVGQDPDGIAVDDHDQKVFVTNESGQSISVIDQQTLTETTKISLTSSVGNTKYDATNQLVYAAVHDGTFVVIDPATLTIQRTFNLANCKTPHGFTFDPMFQQALVTCQGNSQGKVINTVSGEELLSAAVGVGADVVAFDSKNHAGVVSSASGIASIFQFGQQPKKIGDQFIALNAHTVAINPENELVYFPLESHPQPTLQVYQFGALIQAEN